MANKKERNTIVLFQDMFKLGQGSTNKLKIISDSFDIVKSLISAFESRSHISMINLRDIVSSLEKSKQYQSELNNFRGYTEA